MFIRVYEVCARFFKWSVENSDSSSSSPTFCLSLNFHDAATLSWICKHWRFTLSFVSLFFLRFLSIWFAGIFTLSLSLCLCPSCLFFDRLYSHWLLASSCHSCTDNNTHAWPKPYTKTDSSIYNKQTFDFRSRVWQRERDKDTNAHRETKKRLFEIEREREKKINPTLTGNNLICH